MERATTVPENGAVPITPPPTVEERRRRGRKGTSLRTELLFKVLVIGELGCGKTSFIKRYVHGFFSEHYRATIGVDFALKVLNWDDDCVVRLQLWDIAGQERFGNMTRVYYKDAVGAFLLFDLTRADTFHAVEKWKEDLDSKVVLPDGRPIPCVLVGNKCDQPAAAACADAGRLESFARERGFRGWFAASARDDINVEDAARHLVEAVFEDRKRMPAEADAEAEAEAEARGGGFLKGAAGGRGWGRGGDKEDAGDGPRILVLEEDDDGMGGGQRRRKECKC